MRRTFRYVVYQLVGPAAANRQSMLHQMQAFIDTPARFYARFACDFPIKMCQLIDDGSGNDFKANRKRADG